MKIDTELTESLECGQPARLIPTVADSKKEERATSALLATFMVVPSFAQAILSGAGAPVTKSSKVTCLTEVVFKSKDKKRPRPDGLIIIKGRKKNWTALVESKIGSSALRQDQIEEYIALAKDNGIDAVITISNQYATLPTHHPVTISKAKTRTVGLYHFSWLSILAEAILLSGNKSVDDPEQAYLLSELVRYFEHPSSGVTSLTKMGSGWKNLCADVQQGAVLRKTADYVEDSVSSWQQLLKYLSIQLSLAIGSVVSLALARSRAQDPELNFQKTISDLIKNDALTADFHIPNAATNLSFTVDLLRRTISFGMRLNAPTDKARAPAVINWFSRQLKKAESSGLIVRAYYPKRIPMMSAPLEEVLENPAVLVPDNTRDLPISMEVIRLVDLAGRFRGAKTFVEDAAREFPKFYEDVGQHLVRWIPKPPKIKESSAVDSKITQDNPKPTIRNTNNLPILPPVIFLSKQE